MLDTKKYEEMKSLGERACTFLTESVSQFNFVEEAKKNLNKAGFKEILECNPWNLEKGGKYYYTRNGSYICAFTIGMKYDSSKTCFKIIGAHTDSPSLRIAPNSYNPSGGLERYNIQTYGGLLQHTWLDRDLSVCGRVIYTGEDNKMHSQVIKSDKPLFFIPNCPPHLKTDRTVDINKESHLKPILATTEISELLYGKEKMSNQNKKLGFVLGMTIVEELKKKGINIDINKIEDYDLVLYDCQKPTLLGINEEFLVSQRLDNQGSSVPCVLAMCDISNEELLKEQSSINFMVLYDNEEIGSMTFQGCDSNFFYEHLKRIYTQLDKDSTDDKFLQTCSRSFVVSADLAHAYNPNYAEKFQHNHLNYIQKGVVVKINAGGRYSSDAVSGAIIKGIAKKCNVPIQEFIVRQDSPCGTTIGPIITSKLGIKSVDIGIAQFAMHSIREVLGICDLYYYKALFEEFWKSFEDVRSDLLEH